jgi:hypothetical protein
LIQKPESKVLNQKPLVEALYKAWRGFASAFLAAAISPRLRIKAMDLNAEERPLDTRSY